MNILVNIILMLWNMGITAGLMLGWYGTGMVTAFGLLGWVHILPVTFRDLITPRTDGGTYDLPAYLPVDYHGAGEYAMALPGGKAVWVEITDGMVLTLDAVWLIGIAALAFWMWHRTQQLKELGRQGVLLDSDDPLWNAIQRDRLVKVRLCRGLPTSFVYQNGEKIDGERFDMIYLQEELSSQRRELVLRHEWNHIQLRHSWMKSWANIVLVLWWWNPVLWVAYYYFCRDLELACDEKTIRELEGAEQRKQYAQTLVELAAGRMLWSEPLAFGECGAVARVKAAVAWHKPQWWVKLGKWCAFVLVMLFFVGGPKNIPYLPVEVVQNWKQAAVDVELPGGWTPEERWLSVERDGDVTLLAKDTGGEWHRVVYWKSIRNRDFYRQGQWETLSEAPDLTGFQQGLW